MKTSILESGLTYVEPTNQIIETALQKNDFYPIGAIF